MKFIKILSTAVISVVIVGCANKGAVTSTKKTNEGRYKVTKDYGPSSPVDVSHVPDAVPKVEPLSRGGNKSSYLVFGKSYHVMPSAAGYKEKGGASWYGKKFHGYLTANGDKYDMYSMSAAHKSLPLPSYVKVTNLANNKQVIVRVNDRGPFHPGRVIDLSYAAAAKLDMLGKGTAQVEVEAIDPANWKGQGKPVVNKEPSVKQTALSKAETTLEKSNSLAVVTNTPLEVPKKPKVLVSSPENGTESKKTEPLEKQVSEKAVIKDKVKADVTVAKLSAKPKKPSGRSDVYKEIHYVQVGVYSTEQAALNVMNSIKDFELPVLMSEISKENRKLYKVIIGPVPRRSQTEQIKETLAGRGFIGAHLIDLPE